MVFDGIWGLCPLAYLAEGAAFQDFAQFRSHTFNIMFTGEILQ